MKYLILIHSNAAVGELFAAMSDAEQQTAYQLYFDIEKDLEDSGELVDSKALDDRLQRIITRGADGPLVTDAPLPELTEAVSGYYLVDVTDEQRAIDIAVGFPEAAVGGIRVARTLTAEDFTAMTG